MRPSRPVLLARLAALLYFSTAALHLMGFAPVTALAEQGPAELRPLVPLLWLSISLSLAVLGGILLLTAGLSGPQRRWILVLVSLDPLGAAALQLFYLGFLPPTAMLLADSAVAIWAALDG